MTDEEMEQLTGHTGNKSEKIRILFGAGVERADIARFLDISYQHVQNVLKRSGLLTKPAVAESEAPPTGSVFTLAVEAGGRITLPADFVTRQQIEKGELLICREEGGGLLIMSLEAAAAMVREIARTRMPGEAALLDALLGGAGEKDKGK